MENKRPALRVLVVDDELLARARLRTLLADCTEPPVECIGEAANATQAIEMLGRMQADVAMLDIQMPGQNGLKLAQMLRSLPHPPALIFVTAHAQYAVAAFDVEAADYLTKPVRLERLQKSLQKIERVMDMSREQKPDFPHDHLVIQERGAVLRLALADVLFFKAELKYITVRTADRSYLLEGSLSELEERFSPHFLRVHRNALIARQAIRALEKHSDPEEGEGWAVRLAGVDEWLMVSRRQVAAVRDAISA
jgi:two-component system, LytTR family, response regulator AlgR